MLTIEELETKFVDYEQRINRLEEIKNGLIKNDLFYVVRWKASDSIVELAKNIRELIHKPLQLEKNASC